MLYRYSEKELQNMSLCYIHGYYLWVFLHLPILFNDIGITFRNLKLTFSDYQVIVICWWIVSCESNVKMCISPKVVNAALEEPSWGPWAHLRIYQKSAAVRRVRHWHRIQSEVGAESGNRTACKQWTDLWQRWHRSVKGGWAYLFNN